MRRATFASLCLVLGMFAVPTARADTFTAEGTLTGTSYFTIRVFNTADGSTNASGVLSFNSSIAGPVTSPQALEINFSDNNVGNQAIRIKTANPGDREGMVGVTDASVSVPLMWVVFDDPMGYVFTGDAASEAFVLDDSEPDVATYANIAFAINGQTCSLASFPTDNDGSFRAVTDGQVWVYMGANYAGAPAQTYSTSNLIVELYTQP